MPFILSKYLYFNLGIKKLFLLMQVLIVVTRRKQLPHSTNHGLVNTLSKASRFIIRLLKLLSHEKETICRSY